MPDPLALAMSEQDVADIAAFLMKARPMNVPAAFAVPGLHRRGRPAHASAVIERAG